MDRSLQIKDQTERLLWSSPSKLNFQYCIVTQRNWLSNAEKWFPYRRSYFPFGTWYSTIHKGLNNNHFRCIYFRPKQKYKSGHIHSSNTAMQQVVNSQHLCQICIMHIQQHTLHTIAFADSELFRCSRLYGDGDTVAIFVTTICLKFFINFVFKQSVVIIFQQFQLCMKY